MVLAIAITVVVIVLVVIVVRWSRRDQRASLATRYFSSEWTPSPRIAPRRKPRPSVAAWTRPKRRIGGRHREGGRSLGARDRRRSAQLADRTGDAGRDLAAAGFFSAASRTPACRRSATPGNRPTRRSGPRRRASAQLVEHRLPAPETGRALLHRPQQRAMVVVSDCHRRGVQPLDRLDHDLDLARTALLTTGVEPLGRGPLALDRPSLSLRSGLNAVRHSIGIPYVVEHRVLVAIV